MNPRVIMNRAGRGLTLGMMCFGASLVSAPPAVRAAFLNFVEMQKNGVGGVSGLGGAFSEAVTPDGKHVYATGFSDNSVVVFSRNATTGSLTFVERKQNGVGGVSGIAGPSAVAVSPDGKDVYVTGESSDAIAVFSRDATTGSLTFLQAVQQEVGPIDGISAPSAIAVSPDGADVYATGFASNAVAAFHRDATSGLLTFFLVVKNHVGPVDGLGGASGVMLSADGNNLYATGQTDNALAVFSRDAGTGTLTFLQVEKQGIGGVDGLSGASSVAVTADGSGVYATGLNDNAVVAFGRNSSTGTLSFVQVARNGGGVSGLTGAFNVATSFDGTHVYVVGSNDNALAVFNRDAGTQALTFVEVQQDGVRGVDGLAGAITAAVSPDDANVYGTGFSDNALAVFSSPPVCIGDCNGNGRVTVDELVKGVNIALGTLPLEQCQKFDCNTNQHVTIDCLVKAVNGALNGCSTP